MTPQSFPTYPVSPELSSNSHVNQADYEREYRRSIESPDVFWAEKAQEVLSWMTPWQQVCSFDFSQGQAEWFQGGELNVCFNCIDRHLPKRADQTALIWEGDEPGQSQLISYRLLHQSVCQLANALLANGVSKGDRVCIYMPMIPEAVYAMLACARIGAIHSVVFGGFSPEALKDRILDADCRTVITANEGVRGGKIIPLKENVDKALRACPEVSTCLVVKHTESTRVDMVADRDVWYHEQVPNQPLVCEPAIMGAEDPLFILYTSGSTGKPKGVLHTSAGYLLQTALSFKTVFDYREGEVYWCTADVGWITGHSYMVYGPLANGATSLIFAGVPNYPDASRCWQVVDRHKVASFYTAPTALRSLMAAGDEPVNAYSRDSLRILGTVGEPINPEVWEWYYRVVGDSRCPIMDTWWQTETGAHMLTPLPGATPLKPGSATLPFFGVEPVLLDAEGNEIDGEGQGSLCIKSSWPSQIRTVYGNHQRLIDTYFSQFAGYYFTGDGARRDADGYFWITGRVDDVLNVSGHRLGTAEIESALVVHPKVAEAAVVGFPHEIKGEGIYAYVMLMQGETGSDDLQTELLGLCKNEIGAFAKPQKIQWVPALPKTRSGKIMRRILRKIAADELENLGDTSTLADPSVVDQLIQERVL